MPKIFAKADNLNELNQNFDQVPLTQPTFLNSVPKCGTHLIRNIVRMFVPVEQQYHKTFIQIPILHQHLAAFSPKAPTLSWGHLLFSDDSAAALQNVKHIVLVRDPYSWVLARARFFLSDTFQGSLENLKDGKVSINEILNMMILGIHQKAPTLEEIYRHNAVGWMGTNAVMIKYEDIIRNLKDIESYDAQAFFFKLLNNCGIANIPDDWRERILVGADREQSGTARENLKGDSYDIPDELPEQQKKMVDYAAPGLRALLGYS